MDQLMIGSYLKDEAFVCPYCVARVDYWPTLLGLVKTDVFSTALISLIGGYTSIFTITLEKGKYQYLTLSDYGIPKGAQVYRIFFTVVADGSTKAALHPGAAYSNPLPEQAIPATLLLWPTPVPYGQESLDRNEVNVLVTWAPPSGEDDTKQMLVDALFAVGRKDLRAAVIWSNVSVETMLYRLLESTLGQIVGPQRVKSFLQGAATAFYQLNVVLPLMLHRTSAQRFPAQRLHDLNRLRNLRNDVAHSASGVLLDRDEVLTCLCAAVLFTHYLDLIRPHLLS